MRFVALPACFAILTVSAGAYTGVAVDRITDEREKEHRCSEVVSKLQGQVDDMEALRQSNAKDTLKAEWPKGSSLIRNVESACTDDLRRNSDLAADFTRGAKLYAVERNSVKSNHQPGYVLANLSTWSEAMLEEIANNPPPKFLPW